MEQATNGQVIPQEWLTLDEAASRLEKSTKTVERLAKASLIRTKLEPRPGRKPERFYAAVDIDTAKKEAYTAPAQWGTGIEKLETPATSSIATLAMVELMNKQAQTAAETPRLTERYFLTLEDAHKLSGLSKALLLRLAKSGALAALKDPAWKFHRASLERLTPAALVAPRAARAGKGRKR